MGVVEVLSQNPSKAVIGDESSGNIDNGDDRTTWALVARSRSPRLRQILSWADCPCCWSDPALGICDAARTAAQLTHSQALAWPPAISPPFKSWRLLCLYESCCDGRQVPRFEDAHWDALIDLEFRGIQICLTLNVFEL